MNNCPKAALISSLRFRQSEIDLFMTMLVNVCPNLQPCLKLQYGAIVFSCCGHR